MLPNKMTTRFYTTNVASRPKVKGIPDSVWERHRSFIETEIQKGESPEKVANLIRGKTFPEFAPSGRQIRHRLKYKWRFMKWHWLTNCLTTPGTAPSLLGSETLISRDSIENPMILAGNSPFGPSSFEHPIYRRNDQTTLQPSFPNSQVFEMEVMRYENDQNRFDNLFAQPFETWERPPPLQFNFDLLDHLSPTLSPRLSCPGLVPTQDGLPWFSNEFLSLSRSDHQVFDNSKRVNKGDMTKLIIFMLDNNLLERQSKNRDMALKYTRSLPPEAIQSIRLDFYDPETAETAEKLFCFALESNNKFLVTTVIQSELQLPEHFIEATFVFSLRNHDLNLAQFLLKNHVSLESKDPCTNRENWFIERPQPQWNVSSESQWDTLSETSIVIHSGMFSGVHTKRMNLREVEEKHKKLYYYNPAGRKTAYYDNRIHSSLEFASSMRDLQLVRMLLKAKANPKSVPDIHSTTGAFREINPLIAALDPVHTTNISMQSIGEKQTSSEDLVVLKLVQTLTEAGADVNSTVECIRSSESYDIYPPICAAASRGYCNVVRYFLSKGAKIHKGSSGEDALLSLSKQSKDLDSNAVCDIARSLIEAGIDVNIIESGYSALDYAAMGGSSELIHLLLASGTMPSETTLEISIKQKRSQLAHYILDTTTISMNPLNLSVIAIENEMNDVVGKLLDLAHERGHTWPSGFYPTLTAKFMEILLDSGFVPSSHEASYHLRELITSETGNLELLRRLLELAMDHFWNSGDDDCDFEVGTTILRAAITLGDFELTDLLVECGVVGDSCSMDAAFKKGNLQLFRRLLEANLSQPDAEDGGEILTKYYPILKNHHSILIKLLAKGVWYCTHSPRILMRDPDSCFAESAIQRADVDVIKFLLEAGFRLNRIWLDQAMAIAVKWAHKDLLFELLQAYRNCHGACDRGFGSRALWLAVRMAAGRYWNGAIYMLEGSEQWGLTAVETLLSFGVDPGFVTVDAESRWMTNINTKQPRRSVLSNVIRWQRSTEKSQLLTMILNQAKAIDDIVELLEVPRKEKAEEAAGLYSNKFEQYEFLHYTPLLAAVEEEEVSTVGLLLDAGANVNLPATFQTRRTPLQAASESGSLETFTLLLNRGADVHAPAAKYKGGTALQLAAIAGHLDMVYLLLEKNVNVNAPGARIGGRTAIEGAAEHGRVAVLELLLECGGAKIDGDGEDQYHRALRFAENNGHRKAVLMLKRAKEQSQKKVAADEEALGLIES